MDSEKIYLLVTLAVFFGCADSAATCNSTTVCLHGGTCFKGVCHCVGKYIGDRCETAFRCKTNADCLHLGHCMVRLGYCHCIDGYHGANCGLVYNCKTRNPCFGANLKDNGFIYEQPDPQQFLLCDREGRCLDFVWKPSPPGIIKSA